VLFRSEDYIDKKYEEDIRDLGGDKLMVGDQIEDDSGIVDITDEAEVDEFQVLETIDEGEEK